MLKKILVVDDEPQITKLLMTFLEQKKDSQGNQIYKVLMFNGGFPCVDYLKNQGNADFIISDMRMPDGEGTEILKHINDSDLKIPFVFMTGFSGDTNVDDMLRLGAKKVYPKPFKCRELVEEIDALIKAS